MLSKTITLISVILGIAISKVAADPSPLPYSGYTCPTLDNGNFAVGVTNYASDPIFCAYPLTVGSSDTTFNCQYDPVSKPHLPTLGQRSCRFYFVDHRCFGH